jgi:hypothetical protein
MRQMQRVRGYTNATIFDPELYSSIFSFPIQNLKCPVIFDTGASLAITPHITDFIGSPSTSSVQLKLGGMANGMEIAGTGLVCRTFDTTKGVNLPVKTMAYYVPEAKVRLISPQRVFNLEENKGGSYYGDHCGLH